MAGGKITRTFFALAPNGVVHKVATIGINEARAMQKFGRMSDIHRFEVLMAIQVENLVSSKVLALGRTFDHEIRYAFPNANGTVVEHACLSAFFSAIGYDEALKRRCTAQQKKLHKASTGPNGEILWISPDPYRVALPGACA